ncbi:hypothetical protein BAE44_0014473, partial [Dichanthelium oligosanthes]
LKRELGSAFYKIGIHQIAKALQAIIGPVTGLPELPRSPPDEQCALRFLGDPILLPKSNGALDGDSICKGGKMIATVNSQVPFECSRLK